MIDGNEIGNSNGEDFHAPDSRDLPKAELAEPSEQENNPENVLVSKERAALADIGLEAKNPEQKTKPGKLKQLVIAISIAVVLTTGFGSAAQAESKAPVHKGQEVRVANAETRGEKTELKTNAETINFLHDHGVVSALYRILTPFNLLVRRNTIRSLNLQHHAVVTSARFEDKDVWTPRDIPQCFEFDTYSHR